MLLKARTDLAVESCEEAAKTHGTVQKLGDGVEVTEIKIVTDGDEKLFGKPKGTYITVSTPCLENTGGLFTSVSDAIVFSLNKLVGGGDGTVLVAGLGNTEITPDALGPKTAHGVLATRHISRSLAREIGLDGLKSVAVISPGVLGQTGMETGEILESIVKKTKPRCVIVIDALASREIARIGTTVQICDAGIFPGSGVRNRRNEISLKTLGVPVIAIGVPTVADGITVSGGEGFENMIITPREIDLMTDRAAELISFSLNRFLQPTIDAETLRGLV